MIVEIEIRLKAEIICITIAIILNFYKYLIFIKMSVVN